VVVVAAVRTVPPAASKLAAENLTFTVDGERLVGGVDLTVATGETLTIIGPSGAGKSTFLRLLCRLDEPTEGTVYFDGTDYRTIDPTELRTSIGLVPQSPALREGTVRENVTIAPRLRDEPVEPGRVETLLGRVDLAGYADRPVADLSGGEAQRVAIARTLMIDPETLLLDEPTASLDPDAQAEIEGLLTDLLTTSDRTVLLVTHDQGQADRVADRVVRFVDGQVRAEGRPTEVIG
jgi:putative ABC transport system ATP-binding protein